MKQIAGAQLIDGQLTWNGQPILEAVPAAVEIDADPGGVGVFLRFSAPEASARQCYPLGRIAALRRFTCCYRYDPWWTKPKVGTRGREVPVETQYLLAELTDGRYAVLLPILDGGFRAALEGAEDDSLVLVAESGDPAVVGTTVTGLFLAVGADPYALMRDAAASIVARMRTGRLRRDKPLPSFVEQFGWCTWDAFYRDVSHENMRKGLASFAEGGVQPRVLILDDGWLSVRKQASGEERLTAFHAEPGRFPGGLGAAVTLAKETYGIDCFLVWHTLQGYWGGVDAEAFPQYRVVAGERAFSPGILHHAPEINKAFGTILGVLAPEDVARFFQSFHRYLREQGVDGVKVDNQCALEGAARGLGGRVALMRAYHEALEGSAQTHFLGRLINCMSHATDVIYQTLNSTVTRSFTDFWPNDPASHGLHMVANAQVSFWMGEFVHPDWDMFQSGHAMGAYHAAGRAVSGGPVYVSDKPDGHDFGLLRKLVCSDGTILRAREPGRPTRDCLLRDPLSEDLLLKIFNLNEDAGIIGVFHARYPANESERKPLAGSVSPADVEGLDGTEFAVYRHNAGNLVRCARGAGMAVVLPTLTFELVTVVPIRSGFAPIGLTDKFNSAGAVSAKEVGADGSCRFTVRDGGDLLVWAAQAPARVRVDGREHAFSYESDSNALRLVLASSGTHHIWIQNT